MGGVGGAAGRPGVWQTPIPCPAPAPGSLGGRRKAAISIASVQIEMGKDVAGRPAARPEKCESAPWARLWRWNVTNPPFTFLTKRERESAFEASAKRLEPYELFPPLLVP